MKFTESEVESAAPGLARIPRLANKARAGDRPRGAFRRARRLSEALSPATSEGPPGPA